MLRPPNIRERRYFWNAICTSKAQNQVTLRYKSIMTESLRKYYLQPLTLWRLLDFTILRTDNSSSRTKIQGLDFWCCMYITLHFKWDVHTLANLHQKE